MASRKTIPSLELNAPIAESRVWDVLRDCYDPEIPVNIVDLGLVYDVKVEEEIPGEANVFIVMTLTAPGCGMGPDDRCGCQAAGGTNSGCAQRNGRSRF